MKGVLPMHPRNQNFTQEHLGLRWSRCQKIVTHKLHPELVQLALDYRTIHPPSSGSQEVTETPKHQSLAPLMFSNRGTLQPLMPHHKHIFQAKLLQPSWETATVLDHPSSQRSANKSWRTSDGLNQLLENPLPNINICFIENSGELALYRPHVAIEYKPRAWSSSKLDPLHPTIFQLSLSSVWWTGRQVMLTIHSLTFWVLIRVRSREKR